MNRSSSVALSLFGVGLVAISLSLATVFVCDFVSVETKTPFVNAVETYSLGLFYSNMNVRSVNTMLYGEDNRKVTVYDLFLESGGTCHSVADSFMQGEIFRAPQVASDVFAILCLSSAGILFIYQCLHIFDADGNGRRLERPLLSSLVFALSGTFSFLQLLFLKLKLCEPDYGTCTIGPASILAIIAGVLYFVCAIISFLAKESSIVQSSTDMVIPIVNGENSNEVEA